METNQFFSLKRFYLLLRNDSLINYKMYLYTTISAFMGGLVFLYMLMPKGYYHTNYDNTIYQTSFLFCLVGMAIFYGMSFPDMDNKIKARSYLMLPSSTFEKFLSQFLIRMVVGSILFMLIFWIDTRISRLAILAIYKVADPTKIDIFHFASLYTPTNTLITNAAVTFCIISIGTFIFSVRLYFKKNSLVKTAISTIAVLYLIGCFMVLFSHIFYPSTIGFYVHSNGHSTIYPTINSFDIWFYSVMYLSWLFLLPLGYYKLKEKQV